MIGAIPPTTAIAKSPCCQSPPGPPHTGTTDNSLLAGPAPESIARKPSPPGLLHTGTVKCMASLASVLKRSTMEQFWKFGRGCVATIQLIALVKSHVGMPRISSEADGGSGRRLAQRSFIGHSLSHAPLPIRRCTLTLADGRSGWR